MDPPGSRLPPPPTSPPDDDDDNNDDGGGEDEDNRKAVDFGDIDYADINLFYNLPPNTTVSCYNNFYYFVSYFLISLCFTDFYKYQYNYKYIYTYINIYIPPPTAGNEMRKIFLLLYYN